MIGIYKITEHASGRCYIGQSINITRRWKEHQRKWNVIEYDYSIEQECCTGLLDVLEKYFIKKYDTLTPKGLNKTKGGNGYFGHSTEEMRQKASSSLKGRIFTDEWKEKLRISRNKRPPMSDETKQKLSISVKNSKNRYKTKEQNNDT